MGSLLAFAYVSGLLSPLSPCGLALLPAFFAYATGHAGEPPRPLEGAARGVRFGAEVAAGFAGVYVLAGLLIAAGLRAVIDAAPPIAVAIGVVFAVLGLIGLSGRSPGFVPRLRAPLARRGPVTFGAGYALGSMSCTIAVLLSAVAQALATPDLARLLAVFAAYTAGIFTLLVALAVTAALTGNALAHAVRDLTPYLPRIAGAAVLAAGLWLAAYWTPVLFGALPDSTLAELTDPLSGTLTTWLSDNATPVTVIALVIITAGVTITITRPGTPLGAAINQRTGHLRQRDTGDEGDLTRPPGRWCRTVQDHFPPEQRGKELSRLQRGLCISSFA